MVGGEERLVEREINLSRVLKENVSSSELSHELTLLTLSPLPKLVGNFCLRGNQKTCNASGLPLDVNKVVENIDLTFTIIITILSFIIKSSLLWIPGLKKFQEPNFNSRSRS